MRETEWFHRWIVEVGAGSCIASAAFTDTAPDESPVKAADEPPETDESPETNEPPVENEPPVPNTPPVADDQSLETEQDTPVSITLIGTDPDGDALTYTIVTAPAHGTLDGVAPDLIYTPDAGFIGDDSFTFTTNDGPAESLAATVVITVVAPADPPATDEPPVADEPPVTDEPPVESSPEAP